LVGRARFELAWGRSPAGLKVRYHLLTR